MLSPSLRLILTAGLPSDGEVRTHRSSTRNKKATPPASSAAPPESRAGGEHPLPGLSCWTRHQQVKLSSCQPPRDTRGRSGQRGTRASLKPCLLQSCVALCKALPVSEPNSPNHNMEELTQQLNATCTKASLPCQAHDR